MRIVTLSTTNLRSARPRELVQRYLDGQHCVLWCENVQLILSSAPPSRMVMGRIGAELSELGKLWRGGIGAMLIIRSDCRPPSEEMRQVIADELARAGLRAASQVVLGTGFTGAAMRSMLTLVHTMSRPSYPMKVHGEIDEAARWLCLELRMRTKRAPDATHLSAVAQNAHDRFFVQGVSPKRS